MHQVNVNLWLAAAEGVDNLSYKDHYAVEAHWYNIGATAHAWCL